MQFLKTNYNLIGACAALAAVFWSIFEFAVEPYWSQRNAGLSDATVAYLRELQGEKLELTKQLLLKQHEEEIERARAEWEGRALGSGVPEVSEEMEDTPQGQNDVEATDPPVVRAEDGPEKLRVSSDDPKSREEDGTSRQASSLDVLKMAKVQAALSRGAAVMNAKSSVAMLIRVDDGALEAFATTNANLEGGEFTVPFLGVFEAGSILKPLTAAIAIETGTADLADKIDVSSPLVWGRFNIRDFSDFGSEMTLLEAMVRSSNVASARLALQIGAEVQQEFFEELELTQASKIELSNFHHAEPLLPRRWSELTAMTVSFGHGVSLNVFHLASIYLTLANGGNLTHPTIFPADRPPAKPIFSSETSRKVLNILEENVSRGTASLAQLDGIRVGGATGTADKPKPSGGYYEDKVIATFVAVYPIDDPTHVLIVALDEPGYSDNDNPSSAPTRRTAGWTAAPVGAQIISELRRF